MNTQVMVNPKTIKEYVYANARNSIPYKRRVGMKQGFSSGYFGAQGFNKQATLQMAYAKKSSRYIDLTAGGNGVPYRVASELGVPVTTNDMGFYSHCMAKSVLYQYVKWDLDQFLDEFVNIDPVQGWYSIHNKHYSPEVASWIDGVCQWSLMINDWASLAAIGRTMVKHGFRGMGFSKTTANGTVLSEMQLEEFVLQVLRNLYYLSMKNKQDSAHHCSNLDASKFVETYIGFEDATVYMDPAWPWLNQTKKEANPYSFVSQTISSILSQRTIDTCRFWDNDEEEIKGDIMKWVETPLSKGAKYVIVNTQSTNFPNPKIVASWFPKAELIEYPQHTALAKDKTFVEYLIIIER